MRRATTTCSAALLPACLAAAGCWLVEGGPDAAAVEAGALDGAQPDGAEPDASPCAAPYAFTDSFDNGSIKFGWSTPNTKNGTVALAGSLAGGASPTTLPGALLAHVQLSNAADGQNAFAYLDLDPNRAASSLHVKHALLLGGGGPYSNVGCSIRLRPAAPAETPVTSILLAIQNGTTVFAQVSEDGSDAGAIDPIVVAALQPAVWYDVATDLTFAGDTAGFTVSIGPHDKSAPPASSALPSFRITPGYARFDLRCGIAYADPGYTNSTAPVDVAIDDLSVAACMR